MNELKVGLVQHNCSQQKRINWELSAQGIRHCAESGADLVVLQELHSSIYLCQVEDMEQFGHSETIPGPTTDYFGRLAKELGVVIVTSLMERRAAGLYHNTAVVLERDGSIVGQYRKMHIPDDPGYYEKFYFTPGDKGFNPITTSVGRLGVLVCWDQWYPEAARLMALSGADILIYPTAIGWDNNDSPEEKLRQLEAWQTIQRGHAIANGLPLVAVNRIGLEEDWSGHSDGINFWGHSFVVGPQGEFLWQGSSDQPESVVISIDISRSEAIRQIWPFLRDRRIDAYSDLLRRFRD